MSRIKFAKYTEKIRSMLPFWLQMKKQPNESIGLQFLNFFGLQFDDVKKILDYAYKQNKIMEMDEGFIDIVYKAILPTYFDINSIKGAKSSNIVLTKSDSLYHFFGLGVNYGIDEPIHNPDYYFIDEEKKIVYVREAYDKNGERPYGQIDLILKNGELYNIETTLHHVWNFFDEFGALLACPRLFGENNHDYKLRILDVFKNPASSTKIGLLNGIARELGIRHHRVWTDPTKDFIIKDKMVIANQIKINDTIVNLDNVYISEAEGYIVLLGNPYEERKNLDVSYISGIEMRALTDHSNNKFNNETYTADGMPTKLMLDYVRNIKENSSVLWNDFKYNEGVWVTDESEFNDNHFGFVPATLDSNIKGFAKYGFFNKEG